jgi:tRNA-dihydrouridine synthase
MSGFWGKMKSKYVTVLCLAPIANVTDTAFRYIIAKYSKQITPHQKSQGEPLAYVTYTEFVSADGLVLAPEEGRRKLLKDLEFTEIERPIVAQFFTSKPEMMEKAARIAAELGFDGVDINMGCPDRSVEKQGAGAALIKNPSLARELISAAKQGASSGLRNSYSRAFKENGLPVSIKTRLGYNKDELEMWLPELLAENPAAIIIHARTRKEMSKVPAKWERVKRAVEIRNSIQPQEKASPFSPSVQRLRTLIIGNGDVESVNHAHKLSEESGADGAMLGRAIFGNPWLFSNLEPSVEDRLLALTEHSMIFEKNLGGFKNFAIMKKHFKSYVHSIEGGRHLREELMEAQNANDVEKIVKKFLISYN